MALHESSFFARKASRFTQTFRDSVGKLGSGGIRVTFVSGKQPERRDFGNGPTAPPRVPSENWKLIFGLSLVYARTSQSRSGKASFAPTEECQRFQYSRRSATATNPLCAATGEEEKGEILRRFHGAAVRYLLWSPKEFTARETSESSWPQQSDRFRDEHYLSDHYPRSCSIPLDPSHERILFAACCESTSHRFPLTSN